MDEGQQLGERAAQSESPPVYRGPAPRSAGRKRKDAEKAARRVLAHNRELVDGTAGASADSEAEVGGGRTVGSRGANRGAARGDYSND